MTGNTVSEIFDIESSFESTGEESSKRRRQRGESRHNEQM